MYNTLLPGGLGNAKTFDASRRGLRWLKAVQNADGSWGTPTNAFMVTGLVALSYLYMEEMPDDSPEFGDTVMGAVNYLIQECGMDDNSQDEVGRAIVTAVMCEIYSKVWNPNVKAFAEIGLRDIISRQVSVNNGFRGNDTTAYDRLVASGWNIIALETGLKAKLLSASDELLHAMDGTWAQFNASSNIVPQIPPLWYGVAPDNATSFSRYSKDMKASAWNDEFGPQLLFLMTWNAFRKGGDYWKHWFDSLWPSVVFAQFATPSDEPGVKCGCPVCKSGIFGKGLNIPYRRSDGRSVQIGHWVGHDTDADSIIIDTCLAILELTMSFHQFHYTFRIDEVPLPDLSTTNDVDVDFGI